MSLPGGGLILREETLRHEEDGIVSNGKKENFGVVAQTLLVNCSAIKGHSIGTRGQTLEETTRLKWEERLLKPSNVDRTGRFF